MCAASRWAIFRMTFSLGWIPACRSKRCPKPSESTPLADGCCLRFTRLVSGRPASVLRPCCDKDRICRVFRWLSFGSSCRELTELGIELWEFHGINWVFLWCFWPFWACFRLVWTLGSRTRFWRSRWAFRRRLGSFIRGLWVNKKGLSGDFEGFFLEGSGDFVLGLDVVGHGEFVQEIGKIWIGLSAVSFSIAVYAFFKVLDGLWDLFFLKTLSGNLEIDCTGSRKVLNHH